MSRLEQISFDIGADAVAISLSVVSSVQCCIVISGSGEPVRASFISHRPALRSGISTARASSTGNNASRHDPKQNERSCRVMLRTPDEMPPQTG
jgi:hypothetical protein